MNFIRPELLVLFRKWSEVLLLIAILVIAIFFFFSGDQFMKIVTAGIALIALGFLYPTIRVAQIPDRAPAKGMVEVKERRIRYYGPHFGDEVAVDDLIKVEIANLEEPTDGETIFWVLTERAGRELLIPSGAEGARRLYEAFAALEGVDYDSIIHGMSETRKGLHLVWKRH